MVGSSTVLAIAGFFFYTLQLVENVAITAWTTPNIASAVGHHALAQTLPEDFTGGTIFTTVQANNNPTSYTLVSQPVAGMFTISNTGAITVNNTSNLDYETTRSYIIVVRASNSDPVVTATATLTISVGDVNDNTPSFLENSTVTIFTSFGAVEDTPITTIQAVDADSGINNDLQYAIESGDDPNKKFRIGLYSGAVTTAGEGFSKNFYNLVITAVDGGSPQLTGSTTLSVCIDFACGGASSRFGTGMILTTMTSWLLWLILLH